MGDTAPVANYRVLSFRQFSGDLPQQNCALATGMEVWSQNAMITAFITLKPRDTHIGLVQ